MAACPVMMRSMQRTSQPGSSIARHVTTRDGVVSGIRLLIALEAASLGVMAFLHLSGLLGGGSAPFEPRSAGIAEAVIGAVLAVGVVTMWRAPRWGRLVASACVGFAVVGFVVGLTITARGGDLADIVYHATVLPLLVVTLLVLLSRHRFGTRRLRRGSRAQR